MDTPTSGVEPFVDTTIPVPNPQSVYVPDAPPLSGLAFRYFRDEADYIAITKIAHLARVADQFDRTVTVEEMTLWYGRLPDYDPYTQLLLAEIDDTPVAFASFRHTQEVDGRHVYWLTVDVTPAWRGQGLGRALLRHNERSARRLADQQSPGAPCFCRTMTPGAAAGAIALYEQAGYAPVRHFYDMARSTLDDIPVATLPPGLEVRPVEPAHYRRIWDAGHEASYDEWGYSASSEEYYETWLRDPLFDPSLWRIAWDGEEVAGQVRSYISPTENEVHGRRRGYTEDISVRQPWRRQGLATALLCLSLEALREAGMAEAMLGVDAENSHQALTLYERCGFRTVQHFVYYERQLPQEPTCD